MAKQGKSRKNTKRQQAAPKKPLSPQAKTGKTLRDEGLEARILAYLQTQEHPQQPEEIASAMKLSAAVVQKLLKTLYQLGQVGRTRKHAYALPQHLGILVGQVQGAADGHYTFLVEGGHLRKPVLPESLRGALHGDTVWAREEGKDAVRIERIIHRANETMVGTLQMNGRKAFLRPDNRRLPSRIPLTTGNLMEAREGDLIVARVLSFEDEGGLRACVQQRLGEADQVQSAMLAIIYQYGFDRHFDQRVESQAERAAEETLDAEIAKRLDLRDKRIFTIDGADAQDFDDAVSIEPLEGGLQRLGVHIADVSHYVKSGSALDEEALHRGTSVYLPGLVLPMLPEALSNGSCSLRPNEDKLTITVFMDVDASGQVQHYEMHQSVVRSCARLVYEDVNALLAGDEAQAKLHAALLPDLSAMAALSAKVRARRYQRGSLDFDVEEATITVDADGEPVDIAQRPRGTSHRMIEDFMILANETVAAHAKEKDLPFQYRVHEKPDGEKLATFQAFLANVGLRVKQNPDEMTPKALQQLLEEAEGRPDYPVIAQLMIRSMQKARYDVKPMGHFGLAAADYCHFTSPIRRYPDLWIHRVLTAEMNGKLSLVEQVARGQAPGVAIQSSDRERSAMEAERAADKLMMARYMLHHIGEEFEGVVTSVVEWGLYVTLPNTIEGLVHVRTMEDDYAMDQKQLILVGSRTGRSFRLGQSVQVRVERADVAARQIDFVLVDEA